ncbi:EAL domain, c-di-GMP-specific phosphodiesterase class I (or its enzymatically inactive variant) [Ectothiorhodospira magna]|uniref:EAL domain, c-di-GMP-specific phosphodiesterase class I (Or its enzymatically inactive variant) n=1 Tax=Ectothiorhodospira magna TaxID=867345 RepID=A0A1H9F813_9GAMM|nr:EAL domain-containing protein [Ectothiorhodospira magna]SEQ33985.1 EAL domain, c-di-GMP-specific phosphodiesterase class I (or its enzymatically inactive variant) [Ectothiorhodospira magna]
MTCQDCQVIERCDPGPGRLYLAPFLSHTLKALHKHLQARGHPVQHPSEGVLEIHLDSGDLQPLAQWLRDQLSEAEIRDCQAVLLAGDQPFGIAHLPRTQSLYALLARACGGWLMDIIETESLVFHFQPIVHTRRPDQVFAYESLMRGQIPGESALIYPDRLLEQARAARLLFQLDRVARINAIRQATGHDIRCNIFINFNPTTIYDPAYCLRTTLSEAHRLGADPTRFVFEVVETEAVSDTANLRRIVDFYREAGFRVALDDLGAGYASLNLLAELRPDFVKFDRAMVKGIDQDPFRQKVLTKLIEMAGELNIATIAEGVETRAEWDWLRGQQVDYVQGYLFARPATPPPAPEVPEDPR